MRTIAAILAVTMLVGAMPASAHKARKAHSHAKVVSQPTKVTVDGVEYAVCTPVTTDNCVNPREAGLKFGNVPLAHWPGIPASEGGR